MKVGCGTERKRHMTFFREQIKLPVAPYLAVNLKYYEVGTFSL